MFEVVDRAVKMFMSDVSGLESRRIVFGTPDVAYRKVSEMFGQEVFPFVAWIRSTDSVDKSRLTHWKSWGVRSVENGQVIVKALPVDFKYSIVFYTLDKRQENDWEREIFFLSEDVQEIMVVDQFNLDWKFNFKVEDPRDQSHLEWDYDKGRLFRLDVGITVKSAAVKYIQAETGKRIRQVVTRLNFLGKEEQVVVE